MNTIQKQNILSEINIKTIEKLDIESYNTENLTIGNEILKSTETALINNSIDCNLALMPKLLINDYKQGTKVLSHIESELKNCNEFNMSVAFVTSSGITTMLQTLKNLEDRGIKGRIITTDYLNFSEPKALKTLLNFSNIEVKLYDKESFHTKGYIFKYDDHYKIIVGSSNLTQAALTKNKEWNMKISSLEKGTLIHEVLEDFELMWEDANKLTIQWIEAYEKIYRKQKEYAKKSVIPRISQYKLKPNKMQVSAIESLETLRNSGKTKTLLISATGTGKTYLSAFHVREVNPKRALFIVHREQIAKQALESYRDVFGDTKDMGLLSGNSKDKESEFLFSTVQTLCKDEILHNFKRNHFDYIIIDEVHKAGAETYQKIVSYFEPKFLLGMTATPERNDDFNIFQMFDYNIAYEIRLKQALEEDLLCPFHYFGISDICIDGQPLDEATDFRYLVQEERVNHIINSINFYGYCGNRVKGLVFCSNKEEAKELSNKFNEKEYRTIALTGENTQKEREEAIERLEQEERENGLDYIFTVDIFNEGVDIPCINQVVMLRATKSAIIFVQQLGRGLRKHRDKEYVVVIDFVGNYNSNFLIPIALSGDRTYNKDNIRKYIIQGNRIIPGCSTINFDEISKKRIFESIDKTNFAQVNIIKESYKNLKEKLGRIPTLKDFETYESIDPLRIFENNSLGSYHTFLKKYEKEYNIELDHIEELFIEFICKKLASGKRVHELIMIKLAIDSEKNLMELLRGYLKNVYNIDFKESTEKSVFNVLCNEFPCGTGKKTYEKCIFIEKEGNDYRISKVFKEKIQNVDFKDMIYELLEFGINRYIRNYNKRYMDTSFTLYEKYTYEDVCRLLEWDKCEVATNIGGYKFHKETKTYPVFINYHKEDHINSTINYEDRFLSPSQIIAISKSGRTANSPDVKQAYNAEKDKVQMSLFVRKNKDDKISKEFYYLGKINAIGTPKEFIMKGANKKAVEINYRLHTPVREDIYEYMREASCKELNISPN